MAETSGQRLKRLRLQHGFSQRDLAEGLDRVSFAFISRLENDKRVASDKTLRQLATKLGTTAYYLETGRDDRRAARTVAPSSALLRVVR